MNAKENGLSHAFFFCQRLDAAQDLNRRSLEKELGPRIRFFPLPCSGRIESLHLLRALEAGADKVYVITCPQGACRHQEGNTRARKRAVFAQRLISEFGLEPDRFEFIEAPAPPIPSHRSNGPRAARQRDSDRALALEKQREGDGEGSAPEGEKR